MRKQKILAIVAACVLPMSCPYAVTAGEIEKQEVATEVYAAPVDVILSGDASATAEDHVTWQVVQNADGKFKLIVSGTGNMKNQYSDDSSISGPGGAVISGGGACGLPYLIEKQLAPTYGENTHISEVEVCEGIQSVGGFERSKIEKVTLPSGITTIDYDAFAYCNKLSEINIPDTVTSIEDMAFFSCALKTIKLPANLEILGFRAFSGTALTSVTLPYIKNVGAFVFADCRDLKKAVVEKGNTRIAEYMFSGCSSLEEVVLPQGLEVIGSHAFSASLGNWYKVCGIKEISIPESVTTIEPYAFYFSNLKEISIPQNVTTIGENAFGGCSSLKELRIPEGISKISGDVWWECTNLKKVYLPHSLDQFYAFANQSNEEYEDPVFAYGTSLTDVYYNGTKEEWKKIKRYLPHVEIIKETSYDTSGNPYERTYQDITGWDETNDDSFINDGVTIHYLESEKPSTNPTATPIPEEHKSVAMQRLYHPITQEHFYTKSEYEKNVLVSRGWKYEGIGWYAPEDSDTPVYRLYNPVLRDHHYTTDKHEKDVLSTKYGWKYEGIGWYSDDNKTVPIYRRYCPLLKSGSHHYTPALNEAQHLVKVGWKDEGIAWYGLDPDKK